LEFTFKKGERLCSRKAFEILVKTGKVSFLFPLRVQWAITEYPQSFPAQIAFSVPKRNFKRANKRNLLKRRLREAYRYNKHPLYQFLQEKNIKIQLLIVYIAPEVINYHELEPKLQQILGKILAELQKTVK
jgi:ribonuclease P protein component